GEESFQGAFFEAGFSDIELLVETGQRQGLVARYTKCAIRENPFVVGKVSDDLFQCPLAGCVSQTGDLCLPERLEECDRCSLLSRQSLDRVVAFHEVYVRFGITRELAVLRAAGARTRRCRHIRSLR